MPALDQTQIAAYHRDGYIIARQFFDAEETGLLRRAALEDNEIDQRSFGRDRRYPLTNRFTGNL